MAAYQLPSDGYDGHAYSGVITSAGKWVACAADSPDWDAYVEWTKTEGNIPDPYKHPDNGGVTIVLDEGQVAYGSMLDSLPADQGGTPPDPVPVNVDVPYASGTGAVGETLTCTMGNWTNEPTNYNGAWTSDGTEVVGYGAEYVVKESDVGHTLTCVVTAINNAGETTAPPSNAIVITAAQEEAAQEDQAPQRTKAKR